MKWGEYHNATTEGGIESEKKEVVVMTDKNTRNRQYSRRQTTYRENSTSNYNYGNTARKLNVVREEQESRQSKTARNIARNRERALGTDWIYAAFILVAIIVTANILINYIGLQSDITMSVKSISSMEQELNSLTLDNDETYNRILREIDLEEIKQIAIQELGMQYAEEGQVIIIEEGNSDYVKQLEELPE